MTQWSPTHNCAQHIRVAVRSLVAYMPCGPHAVIGADPGLVTAVLLGMQDRDEWLQEKAIPRDTGPCWCFHWGTGWRDVLHEASVIDARRHTVMAEWLRPCAAKDNRRNGWQERAQDLLAHGAHALVSLWHYGRGGKDILGDILALDILTNGDTMLCVVDGPSVGSVGLQEALARRGWHSVSLPTGIIAFQRPRHAAVFAQDKE